LDQLCERPLYGVAHKELMRGLIRCPFVTVVGAIVGAFAGYWLRWLQWEYYSPGSDHSFDYGWGIAILAGAAIGAPFGFLLGLGFYCRR
jgi:hypothetical protein